ncbi:S41 family peptidase, partial [Candidatus Saccharibacteria bacterium]|nr:S41 family peptidase [Candidatus Saccharibacteria bacterium]
MNERETMEDNKKKRSGKISVGVFALSLVLAFVAGNRMQTIGDYFFAPYTNKGNQVLSQNIDFGQVEKTYDILKTKFDGKLDSAKLQDGLQKGLVDAAGDPYTVFLSQKEAEEFNSDLNGEFSGIGAELGKRDQKLVVMAPLEGQPAKKAGVRAGDIIAKIGDEETTNFTIDQAVNKIRGKAGTDIKLSLIRGDELIELTITRASISIPSVKSEILEGNIGYLQLSRFSDDTTELATKAAQDFKAKNVKGIVLDVRNNGGGLLSTAVDVSSLWLNDKIVVSEKEGGKTTNVLRTGNNPILEGIPTKMLINEGSASASEILAGALRDNGAAELVGTKSFGKGSV